MKNYQPVKTYTVKHKLLHTELHGQNGEAHKRETGYNYRWQEEMDLSVILFLLLQQKYTFYFDFWLCACAFSTLTTIFCSSIRKARLILGRVDGNIFQTSSIQVWLEFLVQTLWRRVETIISPVTHTLSTHGASIGSANVLLGLGEPHQNLRSNSTNLPDRAQNKVFSLKTNLMHVILLDKKGFANLKMRNR